MLIASRLTRSRDEAGITIILVALMVTILMIFAAFAIDQGGAYSLRRQYQSQADAGTLAGAALLPAKSDTSGAAYQIMTLVNDNLATAFSASDFNTCADTPPASIGSLKGAVIWSKYTDPTSGKSYSCIAFDSSAHLAWVEIPRTQPYNTTFGKFAGRNTIVIGASAVAGVGGVGAGGVLPLAMSSSAGFGAQCLKKGSGSPAGACSGNATGNYGPLEFGQYGNPLNNTTCTAPAPGNFDVNLAEGLDHDLSMYTGGTPLTDSANGCPPATGAPGPLNPNATNTETGGIVSAFDGGILRGTSPGHSPFPDGMKGRLTRTSKEVIGTFNPTTAIANTTGVDDTGLWQFIPDSFVTNIPASCQRSAFTIAYNLIPTTSRRANMVTALDLCFKDYGLERVGSAPSGGGAVTCQQTGTNKCAPLFTVTSSSSSSGQGTVYDIQLSPRFSYVPRLTGAFPNGVSQQVKFAAFGPVYLQTLSGNNIDFDPGVGAGPQPGNHQSDSISGYVMYPEMLPGTLGTDPFKLGESRRVTLYH